MTDDERAQLEGERFLARSLAQHVSPFDNAGPSLAVCVECGNDIPKARQDALPGVTLCVGCKQAAERLERL